MASTKKCARSAILLAGLTFVKENSLFSGLPFPRFLNHHDAEMVEVDSLAKLSPREVECLALVGAGLQSKEIAPVLKIEPGSVDVTLKRALRRLGMSDRRMLAAELAKHRPDLIQSVLQRLGQPQKSLVFQSSADRDQPASSIEQGDGQPAGWRPFWTKERPWNDLPIWTRRLWALLIALGVLAAALLLISIARGILVGLPRPSDFGL